MLEFTAFCAIVDSIVEVRLLLVDFVLVFNSVFAVLVGGSTVAWALVEARSELNVLPSEIIAVGALDCINPSSEVVAEGLLDCELLELNSAVIVVSDASTAAVLLVTDRVLVIDISALLVVMGLLLNARSGSIELLLVLMLVVLVIDKTVLELVSWTRVGIEDLESVLADTVLVIDSAVLLAIVSSPLMVVLVVEIFGDAAASTIVDVELISMLLKVILLSGKVVV